MATYCNQHWLLSHIRNSFVSTDDTGICETVMVSDDLPKHYLRKYQKTYSGSGKVFSGGPHGGAKSHQSHSRNLDPPLTEADFVCYPGLDLSDDEDVDVSAQSFDIQMYPEFGAHRFRSNTAQKLEKMDIARRRAAKTKCVNYQDEIVPPENDDYFERKPVKIAPIVIKTNENDKDDIGTTTIKSKLSMQLANAPVQSQNKFIEYARFDGTSQSGIKTKRLIVFLNMLPERERNYPIKIYVIASAKIHEVIGFICYTASIKFPDLPLKSVRDYALYMTEDNDDLEDFPPLDNREPCSKFCFSHLTLAERRPSIPGTRIDFHHVNQHTNQPTKSTNSEDENSKLRNSDASSPIDGDSNDISAANNILEAPLYRTFQLNIIDKRFFKTEVTLGIAGDRIEIDQHKNAKFWTKQKAVTYPIDSVAFCEINERRNTKSIVRIWLRASSSLSSTNSISVPQNNLYYGNDLKNVTLSSPNGVGSSHSQASPSHYSSPFSFFMGSSGSNHSESHYHHAHHHQMRFKHYDFETDTRKAEQILHKLNCILAIRSSEVRREFIHLRERKSEKSQTKKHLKL